MIAPKKTSMHEEYGLAKNYALKTVIGELLGRHAWLKLKEETRVTVWRKYALKIVDAVETSIHASILICDEDWKLEIKQNLDHGRKLLRASKTVEGLLSDLNAMLLRQVFWHIGFCPYRATTDTVSLRPENWRLNDHRSVQYIQSPTQVEATFWSKQQKQIGFEQQLKLHDEYKESGSKLAYSRWCCERKK